MLLDPGIRTQIRHLPMKLICPHTHAYIYMCNKKGFGCHLTIAIHLQNLSELSCAGRLPW